MMPRRWSTILVRKSRTQSPQRIRRGIGINSEVHNACYLLRWTENKTCQIARFFNGPILRLPSSALKSSSLFGRPFCTQNHNFSAWFVAQSRKRFVAQPFKKICSIYLLPFSSSSTWITLKHISVGKHIFIVEIGFHHSLFRAFSDPDSPLWDLTVKALIKRHVGLFRGVEEVERIRDEFGIESLALHRQFLDFERSCKKERLGIST